MSAAPPGSQRPVNVPRLHVRTPDGRETFFVQPLYVGRGADCEVQIDDVHVSRKHLAISFDNGRWCCRDLKSSNGVFLDDVRVESAVIDRPLSLRLGGTDGPLLTLAVEAPAMPTIPRGPAAHDQPGAESDEMLVAQYAERYFRGQGSDQPAGKRTIMIRKAFQDLQKRQKRTHGWIVAVLAVAGLTAGGYAYYTARQMHQQQALAENLFYAMKALDLDIANLERLLPASGQLQEKNRVAQYLERRLEMERTYDTFLSGLNVYGRSLTEQERLILKVTRTFGECELVAPAEYLAEVGLYIKKWQSTDRYARAVTLARDRGYVKAIAEEFIGKDLPPQFFYLAMQESDFDPFRTGPPTRMGFAKGMWQFIPETGSRYGLTPGPLAKLPSPDPADDRSQWEKATKAAARYIKDIYSTDAQASGLLVIASYNWGEGRVINLLRTMPANPRQRNFWKLLEQHRRQVPPETYNYVFYIVSAAVIGENPRLFGFPFDSPLQAATTR
jgi:membrane-bound lytic murein transglycosylase D